MRRAEVSRPLVAELSLRFSLLLKTNSNLVVKERTNEKIPPNGEISSWWLLLDSILGTEPSATIIRSEGLGLKSLVCAKEKIPRDVRFFLWWLLPDLNWGHKALQASALPTELKSRNVGTL